MILCCGEALIDMLPRKTDAGDPCFQPFAGGAVFNTAIALARLDAPSGMFTGLSQDIFGVLLSTALDRDGVSTALVHRSDRPTTLAFVELRDGQARYAFYDENTAGRSLTEADLPDLPGDLRALFFGGISLAVTPCADAYRTLMLRAAPDHVTMIDPNIRPGFIRDETAYRARLDAMLRVADIVKLSDEDLAWLMGPGDIAARAAQVRALGPKLVCITEGAKGAWGFTARDAEFVPATRVTAVDTVGAGDTFNAGVLAALDAAGALTKPAIAALDIDTLRAALSLASRAAAVTVSRAGANPPTRADLP